jgi:THO complex subunit 1
MPPSRGKALPLLRTINAFLRFLPRTPEDLVFRGRVHQFASSVIGIADKSAINMRGEYAKLQTTWEAEELRVEAQAEAAKKEDGDGDVEMGDSAEAKDGTEDQHVKDGE